MKIAVRALVLGMLITGFAADHMLATKAAPTTAPSMISMTSGPSPYCQPGISTCGLRH